MFTFPIFYLVSFLNARNMHARETVYKVPQFKESRLRVHGGEDITDGKYSFVVILIDFFDYYSGLRLCTASMISEDWGITAAHCANLDKEYHIWYGNFTESPLQTKLHSEVLKMFIHPSYRCFTTKGGREDLIVNNDISVFRVRKINIKNYGMLSPIDHSTMVGLPVMYVGGGWTMKKRVKDDMYRPLQVGEGVIINCNMAMKSISKYVICIGPKCSKRLSRPWYGDSGGPLIYDGKIVGVCSYAIESDVMAQVGYVPISPYLEWIHDVMHSNIKTSDSV